MGSFSTFRSLSKKQRGRDKPDLLGGTQDETTLDLSYPDSDVRAPEDQRYFEPYEPVVGALANVTPERKAEKKPKATVPIDDAQIELNRARRKRYDTYIEHLVASGGDKVAALALTYGLPQEAITAKFDDFRDDVALGMTQSSVGDLLESAGIGKAARVGMLARHVYSPDPRASLVALKMASELGNDDHDHGQGSYEKYLAMAMGKKQ